MVGVMCHVQGCDCYIALSEDELEAVKKNATRVFADAHMCAQLDGRCIVSKRDILLACRMLMMTGANMMTPITDCTLPSSPTMDASTASC
jgi:hypothetical protein